MFQKNKRNKALNNDAKKALLSSKSQNSEHHSQASVTNRLSSGRLANLSQSNCRSSQSHDGEAVFPSKVEEREAGADSPTFFQPAPANVTLNGGSSSSASFDPHRQSKQFQQVQATTKAEAEGCNQSEEIPRCHVDNILRFYGGENMSSASLDLYRDVLKVPREATDREIRIAYFRRGREILGDNGDTTGQTYAVAKAKATKLDPDTKARFQAVSMAYEILSTPSWKETYLKQGGLLKNNSSQMPLNNTAGESSSLSSAVVPNTRNEDSGIVQARDSVTVPTTPNLVPNSDATEGRRKQIQTQQKLRTALRKSSFIGKGKDDKSSSRRTMSFTQRPSSSVRWKDHVEELVFAKHPNEHASDSDSDDSNDEDNATEDDDIFEDEELQKNDQQRGSARNRMMVADTSSNPSFSGCGSSKSARQSNRDGGHGGTSRNRRRRKNKPKIVIDSEELESHLNRMDSEAEKHFVQDFWDNFEESMDGILSLVDSIGGGGGDSSKGTTKKRKSKTPSTAISSSNASPASSINSSTVNQRSNYSGGNRDASDASIQQSLSHDFTISSKSIAKDEGNDQGFVKRSNSLPLLNSSPSTLNTTTTSPLPYGGGAVVSPDEKGATAANVASDARVSSPYETILSSWPFQSSKSQEENIQGNQQHTISSTIISPILVTPPSKSKSTKIRDKKGGKLSHPSTDLDTTLSVASSILSTSQRRQKFFRPVSPSPSEASDVITSDNVSVSSSKHKYKDSSISGNYDAESDQFELNSRLSGMGSLDLTELDNPFRTQVPSSSSSPDMEANKSLPISSTVSDVSDIPRSSSNSSTKGEMTKKNRFIVSMTSKIRGSSIEKEISPSHKIIQTDKSSTCSETSKSEDVFDGVEEDSQLLQESDMAGSGDIRGKNISIERSISHMSDLSGSMFSRRQDNHDGKAVTYEFAAENPSANRSSRMTASSVMSSSTKKSVLNSTAGRSQESTTYSSFASTTLDDTNVFHSVDSSGGEVDGFFEYFMAYVSAVMTECANVGASHGVAEYHQDFIGLFSNDSTVPTAEMREQPSSMCRAPIETTRSYSSC